MKEYSIEVIVGIFTVVGLAAVAYLSINLGNIEIFGGRGYVVLAEFDSTSGLKEGSVVEIAGVEVGKVKKIQLKDYNSVVTMDINPEVKLPDDSIASIRTKGIIGEKFVKINPGGSESWIKPGGRIMDTEASIDIEELVSKYIFNKENK